MRMSVVQRFRTDKLDMSALPAMNTNADGNARSIADHRVDLIARRIAETRYAIDTRSIAQAIVSFDATDRAGTTAAGIAHVIDTVTARLADAVATLSEPAQLALQLEFVEELTLAEIAHLSGEPVERIAIGRAETLLALRIALDAISARRAVSR